MEIFLVMLLTLILFLAIILLLAAQPRYAGKITRTFIVIAGLGGLFFYGTYHDSRRRYENRTICLQKFFEMRGNRHV